MYTLRSKYVMRFALHIIRMEPCCPLDPIMATSTLSLDSYSVHRDYLALHQYRLVPDRSLLHTIGGRACIAPFQATYLCTSHTWLCTCSTGLQWILNVKFICIQAGLITPSTTKQLIIALEPEAASIYCRKLRMRECIPDTVPALSVSPSPSPSTGAPKYTLAGSHSTSKSSLSPSTEGVCAGYTYIHSLAMHYERDERERESLCVAECEKRLDSREFLSCYFM